MNRRNLAALMRSCFRHAKREYMGCMAMLAAILLLTCLTPAWAQPSFGKNTSAIGEEVTYENDWQGHKATIIAYLSIPEIRKDKYPAMVLLHSSGGLHEVDWQDVLALNEIGIATLVIDGFGSRGITRIYGPSNYSRVRGASDMESGIRYLATLPNIRMDRIGVMGRSLGGTAAMLLNMKRFRETNLVSSAAPRLVLGLYPSCVERYLDARVSSERIFLYLGEIDDHTRASQCVLYGERIRETKASIEWKVYPGAHHSFDILSVTSPLREPRTENYSKCESEIQNAPPFYMRADTRAPLRNESDWTQYFKECKTMGATIQGNRDAALDMRKSIVAEATKYLLD